MARPNYNKDKTSHKNTHSKEDRAKKDDFRRDKSRQDKPRQEDFKKDKPKQERPRQEDFRKDKPRQERPRQEDFRKDKPKHERPRYEDFKQKGNKYASNEPGEERQIDDNILYGRNAVMEALKAGRDIDKLMIQKGEKEGSIIKIIAAAKDKGVVVMEVERSKLDDMVLGEKHQGVVAFAAVQSYVEVEDILEEAKSKGEEPFILILENIQDPHNLGAIIRSAHNAGVHGIIIPKRRAVGLSGTVAKSSAGAIEYMKVAKVTNITQTLKELQEKGIWIACADMGGKAMYEENLKGPMGIVVGSEGEGISKLVRENCDYVVSVPMYGKVASLNASVAASVLVYEVVRQRHFTN